MKKWSVAILYAALFLLTYIYRHELAEWIQGSPPVWLLLALSTLLALFPVMPYKVVVAAAGYVMGTWSGGTIILIGSTLAGAIVYGAAALFQGSAASWLARYDKLERLTEFSSSRPFRTIAICRLIPILPQTAVNIYAGATGMSFLHFILGSLVGKLPAVYVYAYVGSTLTERPLAAGVIAVSYFVVLLLLLWVWGFRQKKI
ncbi:VTT domain-containing protein [Paenibacillus woosongensis]|uniref:TVP38/TMEM64 family membrane protein n=1 Tax=Paenibacillus woosongensis TaxID=307580 RepID=A0AA95L1A2_9BACL|nr:VTT domain-containing protein [Paenibacillus woosongensis]WHX47517.1 VTT domain-containing protein [Paenibacillus woosongensis]